MAEVWEAGSSVRLCFVPWDSGYNDVVAFESEEAQAAYFDGLASSSPSLTISAQTYVRPNVPLTVDGPYSQIHRFNYCIVDNPRQPVENSNPERLFYFITDAEYASPASTRITLQLDVWQTRVVHDGVRLGNAFCERGHCGVVEAYQHKASPLRYCSTAEDIEIGSDYDVRMLAQTDVAGRPYLCVLSTADLTADPGSVDAPKLETARGQMVEGMPSGAAAYMLTTDKDFTSLMSMAATYSWVAQCILGIYYIPGNLVSNLGDQVNLFGSSSARAYRSWEVTPYAAGVDLPNDQNYRDIWGDECDTYVKVRTYPYTVFEVTNFQGSPLMLKPQGIDNAFAEGTRRLYFDVVGTALPPFTRFALAPMGYNGGVFDHYIETDYTGFDGKGRHGRVYFSQWLDGALWFNNLPQFSIVNNNFITYLASSANTRSFEYNSAGWQLNRSSAVALNSYEQAQRSMANAGANQAVQNQLMNRQQELSAIGAGANVVGNLLSLNLGGAVSAGVNGMLDYARTQAQQDASNATYKNNMGLAAANATANQRLAEFVNSSNYQQAIAGINAKVQDAALTPPGIVGQQGGNGMALANGLFTLVVMGKTIQSGDRRRVLQYFERYGYSVRQWVKMDYSTLTPMAEVSYWKCVDVPVTCATATDTEVLAVKGIFAQGVSVYRDPAKIGAVTLSGNSVERPADYYVL